MCVVYIRSESITFNYTYGKYLVNALNLMGLWTFDSERRTCNAICWANDKVCVIVEIV